MATEPLKTQITTMKTFQNNVGVDVAATAAEEQPKRPLSAYNIFFQVERQRLISQEPVEGPYTRAEVFGVRLEKTSEEAKRPHRKMHGKITFVELAKTISLKWKELDTPERRLFEERAENMKRKYAVELEEWLMKQVPTAKIKKRMGALRRGSMSKYLKGKKSPPPASSSSHCFEQNASHVYSFPRTSPVPSRFSPDLSSCQSSYPRVSPITPERRQLQLERARNLERLYQMQIQLYHEQVRLHAECNGSDEIYPPMGAGESFLDEPTTPTSEEDSPTFAATPAPQSFGYKMMPRVVSTSQHHHHHHHHHPQHNRDMFFDYATDYVDTFDSAGLSDHYLFNDYTAAPQTFAALAEPLDQRQLDDDERVPVVPVDPFADD